MRQVAGNQPEAVARWRVVAGVDGSPNSLLALRRAVYAARLCGACAELVYVVPPDASPAARASGLSMLEMALRCEFPGGPGVPVRYTVEGGDPAEILVKRSVGAELLIIGGRCDPRHGKLLRGDVVPYCLGHAACPLDICADQRMAPRPAGDTRPRAMARARRP
jgi:nucleotide-binding universal stress UspA family protein